LRIEDLDPQRSRPEYAEILQSDLLWLGLEWDFGGLDGKGPAAPYSQSLRGDYYAECLDRLDRRGLLYRCSCRRADILASQAPHQSDGRVVYAGTCRPSERPPFASAAEGLGATRIYVPQEVVSFTDRVYGLQSVDLSRHCGDFVLRRADGVWAYQLAVVADDAAMGVTEVVRGCDLLLSAAQQIYLYNLLGFDVPEFAHLPLLCNEAGQRLSKRDGALAMDSLRRHNSPDQVLGLVAFYAGIIDRPEPIDLDSLLSIFTWHSIVAKADVTATI
ncbi:MAG: tRNA glutamyl-Q(34) synthetase GluQRS, partial [Muribaculaceae bacterium]|nr:tRNA glutamyl-Q(34) synthetase GluQRS [Muribaculaceae bacterium]